jgi:putative endonuclease
MSEAPPPGRDRQAARTFGIRAEWAALALLTLSGYRVLARNFTAPGGEIDLIAQRGQTIAFIEVKARPQMDQALIAITEQKRRRIARAAQVWLRQNRWAATYVLRGDAVFIAPRRLPRHLPAAFELDLMGY